MSLDLPCAAHVMQPGDIFDLMAIFSGISNIHENGTSLNGLYAVAAANDD